MVGIGLAAVGSEEVVTADSGARSRADLEGLGCIGVLGIDRIAIGHTCASQIEVVDPLAVKRMDQVTMAFKPHY